MTNAATKALAEIEALLTNLQPHIAQACIPGHAGFIDNYVDPALEIARAALSADPVAADGREPNWQSIETAPAFGKPLLLWWRHAGAMRGRFVDSIAGAGWMNDGDQVLPINQADSVWLPLRNRPALWPFEHHPQCRLFRHGNRRGYADQLLNG